MGKMRGKTLLFVLGLAFLLHPGRGQEEEGEEGEVEYECKERVSCKYMRDTYWATYVRRNCFCDTLCALYGDCCFDYQSQAILEPLDKKSFECMAGYYFFPVDLITKCPSEWTGKDTKEKCEGDSFGEYFLQWPVTGENTGLSYKNIYCAICNGNTNFTYWISELLSDVAFRKGEEKDAEKAVNLRKDLSSDQFAVRFRDPADRSRLCKPAISECSRDWQVKRFADECENGKSSFVYVGKKVYKNSACAHCNGEPANAWDCNGPERYMTQDGMRTMYPYSILMDLNSFTCSFNEFEVGRIKRQVNVPLTKRCPDGSVYDQLAQTCWPIACRGKLLYRNGQCVRLYVSSDNDMASPYSREKPSTETECTFVRLNTTAYEIFDNGTLFVHSHKQWYDKERYEKEGDSIILCTNFTADYTVNRVVSKSKMDKFDYVQSVLSLVGVILSLIALAAHFLVYMSFAPLRNTPGKNIMSLVAALFFAQLAFVVAPYGSQIRTCCEIIAILMHYCFLSSFFWMNVMAFDIWSTFTKEGTRDDNNKQFAYYSLYAWLGPAAVVGLALVVDVAAPETLYRPMYGINLCWINSRPGLLIFFGVPLFLLLIVNSVFFVLTVTAIHQVCEASKMATQKTQKRRFVLYVKLALIMGLTWIFGFLASLTDVKELWYVFTILNSLQGVFIFFGFVFTRKVYRLVKEKTSTATAQRRLSSDITKSTYTSTNAGTHRNSSVKRSGEKV
ncbi:G-protein coupled receptor Mth2-like [Lineus longissimus]|uniref:G-protein coupled receptor Mth2-like n=1 Tax=Lineus longissimus TaxID=88925 RepID=UPI00315D3CA2